MKTFSVAADAALAAGEPNTAVAVKIAATSPFLGWSGIGNVTIASETYGGLGDAALVTVSGAQIGGTEDGIELALSGVDPQAASVVDAAGLRNARTTVWRLMFDRSGTSLLDAVIFDRGRLDKVNRSDTVGGTSTIKAMVETAARGLGRRTGRMTADADQRAILATDNSLARVTQAGELTMAWGGKPPARAGAALPGGYVAGSYGGGPLGGAVDGLFLQL